MKIYEKHPTLDAYRFGPSYTPYAIVAVDKRFTDAELAAEYWLVSSKRERMLAYNDGPNSETNQFALKDAEKMQAIRRFANLPHFDEVDQ